MDSNKADNLRSVKKSDKKEFDEIVEKGTKQEAFDKKK